MECCFAFYMDIFKCTILKISLVFNIVYFYNTFFDYL